MSTRPVALWPMLAIAITLTIPALCPADEITVDGVQYTNVYVRSTDSMFYIQTPEDGKVVAAQREKVDPASVTITEDADTRAAILAQWKASNPRQIREAKVREAMAEAASSEAQAASAPTNLQLQGDATSAEIRRMRSNGYIPYIKLKDVPLISALDGILRPLGLDYRIYGDIVYVSSPELLKREAFGNMVTRQYPINGNDTLHKIVIRNRFGGYTQSVGGGFGGQGAVGGAFGGQGGGFGGQGGGFGGQGGGFGGQGGGFGGQGGGFGGGGQGGGGGRDVTATSNISDLFSTFDDRRVGEAPATIGGGYYFQD